MKRRSTSDSPSNGIMPPIYHDVPSWKVDPHCESKRLKIFCHYHQINAHYYVAIKISKENNYSDITMTWHVYLGGPVEKVIKENGWIIIMIVRFRLMTRIQKCSDCWNMKYTSLAKNNIRWRKQQFSTGFLRLHEAE